MSIDDDDNATTDFSFEDWLKSGQARGVAIKTRIAEIDKVIVQLNAERRKLSSELDRFKLRLGKLMPDAPVEKPRTKPVRGVKRAVERMFRASVSDVAEEALISAVTSENQAITRSAVLRVLNDMRKSGTIAAAGTGMWCLARPLHTKDEIDGAVERILRVLVLDPKPIHRRELWHVVGDRVLADAAIDRLPDDRIARHADDFFSGK